MEPNPNEDAAEKLFMYFVKHPDALDEMGFQISAKGKKLLELLKEGWKWEEALAIVEAMEWPKK